MYYLESRSTDPCWNLALEQYAFDVLGERADCFMLWQNDNAVIVGKHQNTLEEINAEYVKAHGISVVRRLSGGGAVYHDMGNLNFTFVAKNRAGSSFDFATFCRPVLAALHSLGVPAELNGRNDMTIHGRKFSGNSQYMRRDRVMHHGTLMYDSNLDVVGQALQVKPDKIVSKGFKSVRSRITNIRPYVKTDLSMGQFRDVLRRYMFETYPLEPYALSPAEEKEVARIREDVYTRWEWNYGISPPCDIRKERRVEGCGTIQIHMRVEGGAIARLSFYGDYFSKEDSGRLADKLTGAPLEEAALRGALKGERVGDYFCGLGLEEFLSIMLQ